MIRADLAVVGIAELATPVGTTARTGVEAGCLRVIADAAVACRDGRVVFVGPEREFREVVRLEEGRSYSINEFMTLDASTRRNLELNETLRGERKGSLLGVLDRTVTPMGKRLIHQWISQPLLSVEKINRRQDGVQHFFDNGMKRAEIRNLLKPLADLERLVNRVMAGQAQPRDLVAMHDTLGRLPAIKEVIGEQSSVTLRPGSVQVSNQWSACEEELALLKSAIDDDPPSTLQNTGIIRVGYSQELDFVVQPGASMRATDCSSAVQAGIAIGMGSASGAIKRRARNTGAS